MIENIAIACCLRRIQTAYKVSSSKKSSSPSMFGKFAVCASHHVYHLNCAMMVLGSFACLHCGQDPLDRFMVVDVHAGKSPIFFPHPQVPKKRPSAKMCFGGSHTDHTKPDKVPLTESIALTSKSVTEMPETFSTDLDKEKLANFLSVASSMLTNPLPAHSLLCHTVQLDLFSLLRTCTPTNQPTTPAWIAPHFMFSKPSVTSSPLYSSSMGTPLSIGSLGGHYRSPFPVSMGSSLFSHRTMPGSSGGYLTRWFLGQSQSESDYPTWVHRLFESAIKLSYVTKEQYCFNPLSLSPQSHYLLPQLTLPGQSAPCHTSGLPLVPPRPTLPGHPSFLPRLTLPRHLSVPPQLTLPGLPHVLSRLMYTSKSLYSAAKNGNTEKLISVLASGLNPNILFRECLMGSVLHLSSSSGHLNVVQILVQAGAQLDVLDRAQNTPLMLAVLEGKNEVVNFLIKAGASVMLKGMGGMTALHLATKSGNQQACQHILAIPNLPRDFIDTKDDGGWTPLVWAAEHSHAHIVEYLLSKRANPFVRDAEQNIALHWSAFSGCAEITELLLNLGSDPNSTNLYGDTPLHIGARQDMYDCVHLLLARRARVDLKNSAGELALDCCVSESSECFKAISLNIMLRDIVIKTLERTVHILTNDISHGKEVNPIQCINWEDDEGEPTDYVYVSTNCFTSYISIDQTITSLQSCRCTDGCTSTDCRCNTISLGCPYDNMGRLVPDFNYADAPMVFECNQMCACNRNRCVNRVMQKSVTEHVQLFRTRSKGWGVRMLRPIPKGTYVCEYIGDIVHDVDRYIGEAITDVEADHREDDSYLFDLDNKDGETYCIDARHYGNVSRFINHMCVPNLIPVKVFVDHHDLHFPRIAFFANRDIDTYEELGFDYGEKFWIIKSKSFTCDCGADNCRYSKMTITQTLENYLNRLQEMDRT
uniref:Uncharacterized protein n=1 Tax=Timema tahoe TaxID=61484 RepID=A0A7R9ILP5_9NEOP|nr:unnamed protein product [Timema tahoe]